MHTNNRPSNQAIDRPTSITKVLIVIKNVLGEACSLYQERARRRRHWIHQQFLRRQAMAVLRLPTEMVAIKSMACRVNYDRECYKNS